MAMEMTVDPELLSTMVFVSGPTPFSNRFIAVGVSGRSDDDENECGRTWNDLNVGRRVHGHHLGVDAYAIRAVRVQTVRNLNQRQWSRTFWVKVIPHGVWPGVDVEWASHGHYTKQRRGYERGNSARPKDIGRKEREEEKN